MRKDLFIKSCPMAVIVFLSLMAAQCKKTETITIRDTTTINKPESVIVTSISPDRLTNGIQVTVTGKNFGTDMAKTHLSLENQKMVITALTNTSITFTIPEKFVQTGQKDCFIKIEVEGLYSYSRWVSIYYVEPKGWFYSGIIPNGGGNSSQIFTNLIFPTDSLGFAQRVNAIYRTYDGGITWHASGFNGGFSYGYAIASSDGKNIWSEFGDKVAVSTDGSTWTIEPEKSSFGWLNIGLYTSGPANGLIANTLGRLYDVDGRFFGATVKYQSPKYDGSSGVWDRMSALDKNNLIITNNNSYNVVLEKAGVFSEVDISSVSSATYIKALQMVDANTVFLVNFNNELIKYAGNTWTKLTQQANAVYFTDNTTGYIAYNNKILKTTDGGASWNEQFTLNANDKVAVLCARNGKVWALGNNSTQGFVVKYNP